jgi:hypothetical protein
MARPNELRRIEALGNERPREMVISRLVWEQNPAYRRAPLFFLLQAQDDVQPVGQRARSSEREQPMNQQYFTPEMTVDEAFKLHAGARRVFARFHLGGCSNCAISETHTIGAISVDYGIPLPMLLDNLNGLFDQSTLAIGTRVRVPDEIRSKIPQLANVPDVGEITGVESGAYTADFGDVRLQGLAEDFIALEAEAAAG